MQEAISRAKMFKLIDTGGFSFEDLGVPRLSNGAYPSRVIEEHLIVRGLYYKALEDGRKLNNG